MSAAAFKARYAAYTLDLVLLSPALLALAWRPLGAAFAAWTGMQGAMQLALDRAFSAGHIALFDLATALRADGTFIAAMTQGMEALLASLLSAGLWMCVLRRLRGLAVGGHARQARAGLARARQ